MVQVPLNSYFNNKGFGLVPGEANFDQLNNSYPALNLPPGGIYISTKTNVSYLFPGYQGQNASDNVVMAGQKIDVPSSSYFSLQMLISTESAGTAGNMTLEYTDGTSTLAEVRTNPYSSFLSILKGEVVMPSYFTSNATNFNTSHIFEYVGPLTPSKTLSSITLPDTSNESSRIHLFSMSLVKQSGVQVQFVRPTQKHDINQVQTVELVIDNSGPEWIAGSGVEVFLTAPGIQTVQPGYIKRLRPGDQKKINVGVIGRGNVTAQVHFQGSMNTTFSVDGVAFGLEEYTSELGSLSTHESPEWFDQAKFGIFIHWGPYCVPGWGNSTPWEIYAEWYWWYNNHRNADKADVYDHQLNTFGGANYDDFFSNFTANNWEAKDWVDLIADAGAQYFVITTKHHDGFAMFDTEETTHRNSLHYGPMRDVVGELFDAAKEYQPKLRRGTYFSFPEWFNPLFGPYGFSQTSDPASTSWPGIIATNPYTGLIEPYTGAVNKSDFIVDLMVPQMEILAYKYETDIMWCDCGAANGTADFAAKWFNEAASQGRQVTMNNRCGIVAGADFDTPEYTTFSSISERKWESNQGMDPYSYGYNQATPADLYMNASTLINSLVDMVSKNGNFLLDVGPKADGTIDATEIAHLLEAGTWIKPNAEAIFNTTYWQVGLLFITPEVGDVRFTQTDDAFYILSLSKPSETFVVSAPLPILEGDLITMVGAGNNTQMSWVAEEDGISITVPSALSDASKYCWVFKIAYSP
ncbi:glycoside hydrolase family 29 protein [Hyaloscypha variabilis F]|uniref:alpha-L-fucosidase n=1 Tax=Hyaloscypha variabilis (strain UAMH 11265 / GT02V1 / F) TaxID=1149755 RepID=A0A2J6RZ46_HYAVF|nr:glycoside hydrolase family 29 protein [Hyaloscypha variabilis F]